MPEFIVDQTLILETEDQAKAAERAQQIATFIAHDWPEVSLISTNDVEPCPPFIENPDEPHGLARQPAKVIRDAVDEAWGVRRECPSGLPGWRQTNDAGLQHFQCCGDPADCQEVCG